MVCLNYQTWDLGMRLNQAKFVLNGGVGYVLRPDYLNARKGKEVAKETSEAVSPAVASPPSPPPAVVHSKSSKLAKLGFETENGGGTYTLLKIHLICGCELPRSSPSEQCALPEVYDRYCPASKFQHTVPSKRQASVTSPYCVIEVHGGGGFRCAVAAGEAFSNNHTFTTQTAEKDGLRPKFDVEVECVADEAEDAIISFHIYEKTRTGSDLVCYEMLPMHAMRDGYRVVRMRSATGSRLQFGSLFMHLQKEDRVGGLTDQGNMMKGKKRCARQASLMSQSTSAQLRVVNQSPNDLIAANLSPLEA